MQKRCRRHLADQCQTLAWAIERLINGKGANKDFVHLDEETQKMFCQLLTAIDVTSRAYESWLWDKADKVDKAGGDVHSFLPKHMSAKVKAVQDFVATLPPHASEVEKAA